MPSIFSGKRLPPEEPFSIIVRTMTNEVMRFDRMHPSTTIKDIKTLIETQHNVPIALQKLDLLGQPLGDRRTLEQCDITNGTAVNLTLGLRQSMIYLTGRSYVRLSKSNVQHTPNGTQNIKVQLSLNRAWELSVIFHSSGYLSRDFIQSMSWTVDASSNGMLHNHDSGIDMPCLFWDGLWVFLT
jgi:hypothetical protein